VASTEHDAAAEAEDLSPYSDSRRVSTRAIRKRPAHQ